MRESRSVGAAESPATGAEAAADVEAGIVAGFAAGRVSTRGGGSPAEPEPVAARERLAARLDTLHAAAARYAAARRAAGAPQRRILAQVQALVGRAMHAEGYDDPHVAAALEDHVRRWCAAATTGRPRADAPRPPWGGLVS